MFVDRKDAGSKLAEKLLQEKVKVDLVVGLARGGVAVSSVIARKLGIQHHTLRVKKIGSPGNPELAVGATVPEGQSLDVRGKSIILTDDGIATGATMRAAINWVKSHGATHILVAVPVAPSDVITEIHKMVDVVVLERPVDFGAVGEFYQNFPQLTDQDVVKLLT